MSLGHDRRHALEDNMNHDAPRRSRATTIVALLVLSAGLFAISAGAAGVKECRGNSPTKGCPVLTPANGSVVLGSVTVAATPGNVDGAVGVQFAVDGRPIGVEDVQAPFGATWDTTQVANGTRSLSATVRAANGDLVIVRNSVTVNNPTPDTTPPSVQLTSPTAGSTVTGAVNVSANASDNIAVAGVQFKLDGANLGSEDTTSPYTTSWTTSSASNGSHTLTAVARDTAGLTTTTTTTVTVSNSVVVSGALAWAPPTLSSPITLDVRNGSNLLFLDTSKDYILRIQEKLVGNPGLYINGGRNVVVIGGTIEMNALGTSPYWDRTAIKLHNSTGVVHLEGLRLTGAYLSDGIATSAPNATIQLQNIRIDNVQAFGSEHPDCVQAQAGLGRLRVDRLTCRSTLQGIFLSDEAGYVGSADIRRVNITGTTGSNLFWQRSMGIAVSFSDVWLNPPASYATGYMTYPNVSGLTYDNQPTTRRAVLGADGVSLTYVNTNISGTVRRGVPPSGDFASSSAGTGYVSPGYAG
jgi:hypothetical protein